MPKLGAKPDDRPYNTRCRKCGCLVEKLIARFNLYGKGVRHSYRCANPYHNCGTVERDGCEPYRVYGEPIRHVLWGGDDGEGEHPGTLEDCELPDCADRKDRHRAGLAPDTDWHPGPYVSCNRPECEPPF